MYKILSILTILLIWNTSQGQVVITFDDLPNETTQLPIAIQDSVSIDILGPSINPQVWDWSNDLDTDVLTGDNTDYVDFGPVAGTSGQVEFSGSDFSRTSNLITILGFDIASFLPDGNATAPVPADAYFSISGNGDIYLDGVAADIQVDTLELGRRFLYADPPIIFYPTAELGDTYGGSTIMLNDILAEELPIEVPVVSFFRISLEVDMLGQADAYGTLILPDTSFNVLRYRETSTIRGRLTPWAEILGAPVEINPDLISDQIIENLGFDPNEIFFDTTFNSTLYRYYTPGANYPVATVNQIGGGTDVFEGIEYYIEPIDLFVTFQVGLEDFDCYEVLVRNTSDGLGVTYDWDFGNGNTETVYGNFENDSEFFETYPGPGDYTITLVGTDVLGNSTTYTKNITLEECWPAGLESLLKAEEYELYPNPVSEVFSIKLKESVHLNGNITIFDASGKLVYEKSVKEGEKEFVVSLSSFAIGNYFVNIYLEDGTLFLTDKVILKN